ncbi:hypothetical protein [Fimbriiglobus ruber]|uniref:HEAT repeat domain-containing protein n=1 Tax=Fimbriiglobus ruber TaxID=1908690 RepID=A0A225D9X5_9BACT|nr:hypothetical protein [Fimbriiglobus ruber]OWK37773.1 hypothetical protein FRUB_06893 [Fimbriiglobus ruber]
MKLLFCLSGLLVLVLDLTGAAADSFPPARTALDRFYAERLKRPFIQMPDAPEYKPFPPPWAAPLKQLASETADDRRAATAYLRALLILTLEDEQSGQAPWRNTPYWGGGADVPARDLRKEVADELAKAKPSAEVLPVLRWYLENEPADRFLSPVVAALGKVDGEAAGTLRADLATKPHPNAVVVAAALRQIAASKQVLPAETVAALCHHHRAAIRDAARALNTRQDGKNPGAFDAAKTIRTEPVAKLMGRVLELLPDLPAAKAEFVTVTVRHLDDKMMERKKHEDQGWLVKKDAATVEIYTPYGRTHTYRDKEKTTTSVGTPSPDGRGISFSEVAVVTAVSVTPTDPADVVKIVVESRKKGSAGNDLSEQGGLTGQFRGSGATLFEAMLGAWLFRAGRDADAARVILPALDSLYRDEHLVHMVRDQMGELVGQKMLVAFVGDRDYGAALGHARQINEKYPDTRFHDYAKELAVQLPKRADDFAKLKLPTPVEWTALKKMLTRDQQIDFLCERMRLLNCFQMGQPGGYSSGETQYAEPRGLSDDAAWGRGGGDTVVINPLTELTGQAGWLVEKGPRSKGLELAPRDIPRLSKYLRDDWYMLIVSFWRDFSPERNLAGTRRQFTSIIDSIAHRDICHVDQWKDTTPATIDREIERINKWAAENANKTSNQVEWEALEEALTGEAKWYDLESRFERLLAAKEPRVFGVMKRLLDQGDTDAQTKYGVLHLYLEHDANRAKDLAPKYLTDKDELLRLTAALIVFKTGDKTKARAILGNEVAVGSAWSAAANALLEDDSPESKKDLARLFTNRHLPHDRYGGRPKLLARCAAAGLKEPYTFYLKLLDVNKNQLPSVNEKGEPSGTSYYEPSVAESFAAELASEFAPDDATVKDIAKKFPKTKDQILHLKKWLQSRAQSKD